MTILWETYGNSLDMRQLTCHNRQKEHTFTETNDDKKSTYILYECIPLHKRAHTRVRTHTKNTFNILTLLCIPTADRTNIHALKQTMIKSRRTYRCTYPFPTQLLLYACLMTINTSTTKRQWTHPHTIIQINIRDMMMPVQNVGLRKAVFAKLHGWNWMIARFARTK